LKLDENINNRLSNLTKNLQIEFDSKSKAFIHKKKINHVIFDVEFIEEVCSQIYSPIISTNFKEKDQYDQKFIQMSKNLSYEGLSISFSELFLRSFDIPRKIIISIEGLLQKNLYIKNIQPIIKNICKI
jgi:hypothetical protein